MKNITIILTLLFPCFIYSQNENLIPYTCQEKWGYCNEQGDEVINPKYDLAQFFVDGKAVVMSNNKFGMIDKNGIEILPCKYNEVKNFDHKNDLILARKNKKWLQFNSKGNRVNKNMIYGSTIYDCVDLSPKSGLSELYIYERKNKYGFVSYKCNDTKNDSCKIYGDLLFDKFQEIGLKHVAFRSLNKWKIYNYLGEQFNFQEYEWIDTKAINRRGNLFYRVKRNDKFGLINSDGEEIVETKYDKLDEVNEIYNYSQNWYRNKELFLKIEKDSGTFYINSNGTEYVCSEK